MKEERGDRMSSDVYQKATDGLIFNHYKYEKPGADFLAAHTHNDYEFLYIVSGDVTHSVEDRKYKLKKDDLVIIKPSVYHYLQINSPKDYERYNVLFDPEALGISHIGLLSGKPDVINCKAYPVIGELFKKSDYYRAALPAEQQKDVFTLLLKEMIYNIGLTEEGGEGVLSENVHPLITRALSEINNRLFTLKSVEELAKTLFVSESYLYRIFMEEIHTTPKKYITEKRLLISQSRILCGENPTQVYAACGFTDYSSFYRSYVNFFGHSPVKDRSK
jgi:AraC-like DNA-binding protein